MISSLREKTNKKKKEFIITRNKPNRKTNKQTNERKP